MELNCRNLRAKIRGRFRQVFRIYEVVLKTGVSIGEALPRMDHHTGEIEPAPIEVRRTIAPALVDLALLLDGNAK